LYRQISVMELFENMYHLAGHCANSK
jgi:hypothetical protein